MTIKSSFIDYVKAETDHALADMFEREANAFAKMRVETDKLSSVRYSYAPITMPRSMMFGLFDDGPAHPPADPLDAVIDGWRLRDLITVYRNAQREACGLHMAGGLRAFTSAQRAAVSAQWSAELRAKVAASTAADKEREARRVLVDQEDD